MKKPNSLFVPSGHFMLRIPQLTMEDFFKLASADDSIEVLKTYFEDPFVKEAIYIASSGLFDSLSGSHEKKEQAYSSLLKYLLRMATRATPFGLFSSAAVGHFDGSTSLSLELEKVKKRVRPDMEWLFLAMEELLQDLALVQNVKVIQNPLSYKSGNRLYLNKRESGESKKQKISIRTSYLTDFVFEAAKRPILFSDLVSKTCEAYPKLDPEKIGYLIGNLFQKQYLISELTPSLLSGNPFQTILNRSPKLFSPNLASKMESVQKSVEEYNSGSSSISALNQLSNQLQAIKESPHYFQVDSAIQQEGLKVNQKVAEEIADSLEMLWKLFSEKGASYLENYHSRFMDKYHVTELVPIEQVVDDISGICLPIPEQEEQESRINPSWQTYLHTRLLEVLLKKEPELVLSEESLSYAQEKDPMQAVPSCEVFCEILSDSQESIDKGDFLTVLRGACWGGGTFGRFTDILENQGEALMNDLFSREQNLEPQAAFVESSYLPSLPRHGNVAIHRNFRNYEINLNYPSSEEEKQLDLADIYVGATHERLFLFSKKLNREINVTFSNVLNPSFAPPLLRLMRDITKYKYFQLRLWDWGKLGDFPYLPRVRYKNTVLSPALWKISLEALKCKATEMASALQNWLKTWQVPRYVYMTFLDNKILLDLCNKGHLEELAHELKTKKNILLTEHISIEKSQWIKSSKGSHCGEFVIPFLRNPRYTSESSVSFPSHFGPLDPSCKFKPPGGEWLYAKIFLPFERQEEFLVQHLAPFANSILQQNQASFWFYIRYAEHENDPHIRLRFQGDPQMLTTKVLPQLYEWTLMHYKENRIKTIEFGSYEREVRRYGGPELIEAAERLFASDSQACCLLLREFDEHKYGMPLYALAAVNVVEMLYHLGLGLEDQLNFFELLKLDKKYLEGFKAYSHALIQMSSAIFETSATPNSDWLSCLRVRQPDLERYGTQMSLEAKEKAFSFFQSFIHMHCNRLMGVDREKEMRALAFAQHILVKIKHRGCIFSSNKV